MKNRETFMDMPEIKEKEIFQNLRWRERVHI